MQADRGSIEALGLDPVKQLGSLKPLIGVMPQVGGVYQAARCLEMLNLVASYYRDPLNPEALLERLGMTAKAKTPFRQLSVGQQQRLSLAIALIGRPKLVFLDEPTVGLDPQSRSETHSIIEELRADGTSVVLTTHYMEEAERLADQVVVIDHGQVIASGTVEELISAGTQPEVHFVIGSERTLKIEALQQSIAPEAKVISRNNGSEYVVSGVIATPQIIHKLTSWLADNDHLLVSLKVSGRTLEDVFIDLTGKHLRA